MGMEPIESTVTETQEAQKQYVYLLESNFTQIKDFAAPDSEMGFLGVYTSLEAAKQGAHERRYRFSRHGNIAGEILWREIPDLADEWWEGFYIYFYDGENEEDGTMPYIGMFTIQKEELHS